MKNLFLIVIATIFLGCVWDRPTGFITVINNTDSTIYVRYSDTDYIRNDYPMVRYSIQNFLYDKEGEKLDSIIFPSYRASSKGNAYLNGFGTPKDRQIPNESGIVYLFIINESILTNNSWAEICRKQIYEKKMRFSKHELDSLNWTIVYE